MYMYLNYIHVRISHGHLLQDSLLTPPPPLLKKHPNFKVFTQQKIKLKKKKKEKKKKKKR